MSIKWPSVAVCLLGIAGCNGASDTSDEPSAASEAQEPRETVFDPLTETLDRAEGVEDTLREQSEEQRRRIEEAEQ